MSISSRIAEAVEWPMRKAVDVLAWPLAEERRKPVWLWGWRFMGALMLPLRLWEWSRPSCTWCSRLDGTVLSLRDRLDMAWTMWNMRYWYDWSDQ